MTIAIAGGTGTLGRRVAEELRSRGHEVRVLSRGSAEYPVDLTTGVGLAAALDGVDVVVDAANDASKQAAQVLVEGSRHLLAAEEAAGVGHHVAVSIVGCDLVPARYLQAKAEQERVVEGGPVPWTIVRATQFHELIDMALAPAARRHVMPVPRVALQTVAADDAARAVADVAEGPPRRERVEVVGPERRDARELAKTWRAMTGRRALLLPFPLLPKVGRPLRAGALTAEHPDVRGTIPFAAWLAAR